MKPQKYLLTALLLLSFTSLSAEEAKWDILFDGKSLKGWKAPEGDDVKVVDGEIHILTKKNIWVLHENVYENFELEAEVLMPKPPYNSGLGFRCTPGEKKPKGYQAEVAEQKSGAIHAIGKGWVHPAQKSGWNDFYKVAGDCFKTSAWNKIKVIAKGKRIQVWINGHQTTDVEDGTFSKGSIGIQHHGKGGTYKFKNIRARAIK